MSAPAMSEEDIAAQRAARDREPVAWRWRHVNSASAEWNYQGQPIQNHNEYLQVEPLYSAPPVAAMAGEPKPTTYNLATGERDNEETDSTYFDTTPQPSPLRTAEPCLADPCRRTSEGCWLCDPLPTAVTLPSQEVLHDIIANQLERGVTYSNISNAATAILALLRDEPKGTEISASK